MCTVLAHTIQLTTSLAQLVMNYSRRWPYGHYQGIRQSIAAGTITAAGLGHKKLGGDLGDSCHADLLGSPAETHK